MDMVKSGVGMIGRLGDLVERPDGAVPSQEPFTRYPGWHLTE
jgi:hypothetical protein